MEQHPIPQQISSYEFHLVGDMTLKQFFQAAVGIVLALLINSTKMFFLIKWPLMALFAGGGLAMAFVPYQDRPLETWIRAFIKSIYSPTIFVYKKAKTNRLGEMVKVKGVEEEEEIEVKEDEVKVIKDKRKISEFIESLPSIKRESKDKMTNDKFQMTKNKMEEGVRDKVMEEKIVTSKEEEVADWREGKVDLNLERQRLRATGTADFGEIPMPDIPEVPNLLVGMVTDSLGKIVEGAIVEIQDEMGNPSRVLKTNALGQFRSSTQLANGKYLIIPEKDDLRFDRVEINLNGKIIEPVRIKAV